MKLIFAIVGSDDSSAVQTALTKSGHTVTKLASSGGFMRVGNTTFMICTEDRKVDEVINIIKVYCSKRTCAASDALPHSTTFDSPIQISDGGATVFVTDVTRFEKL